MKAALVVGAVAFIVIFVSLWFLTSPQVSLGAAALGSVLVGLAQLFTSRSSVAISEEQLSILRRQEERHLERAERAIPDLKASVEFKARSELKPRGIHADATYNALVTLDNHGLGTAEKVTVTATRDQSDPLIHPVGIVEGGATKFIALPLQLGPSIEATPATIGRTIVIDYDSAASPIVFRMAQTHPPAWEPSTPNPP